MPNQHQQGETKCEGKKTAHGNQEFFEAFGDFEGNNEQGDGKPEYGIAEGFNTLYVLTTETETVRRMVVFGCFKDCFPDHTGMYEKERARLLNIN